ncbi:unnamed protein product [Meganyctiphanes norvegica]|uniref:Uncharacterized protein n=1 Tax=Meganyctiphanes norvegica TaxID=48144 RepID=A0AAV2PHL3_MEGNR
MSHCKIPQRIVQLPSHATLLSQTVLYRYVLNRMMAASYYYAMMVQQNLKANLSDDNVKVDISTDGHVDVSATLSDMDDIVLEVVVYDDKFPHVILSNDNGYNCTKNQIRGNKYSCSQEAQLTKDIEYVWVLVVAIRSTDNTVVQSTKIHTPINVHDDTTTEVWVIVVSSIGAIFGAIFILFAILVTWKKMGSKKEEKKNNSQVADTRSEDKEQHGDDLHMNHLRSEHPSMHGAAHENPAFAHNRTNTTNNIQQNSYTEPYSSDNVPNRLSRSPEYPRTNHQNPYARSSNPPIRNDQFRCPQPIPAGNAYRRPLNPAYPTAYSPQMRAKEPIYDRLSKDNATAKALERVPIGPIPRVTAHPNRVKQHIPPHGNWDVEI